MTYEFMAGYVTGIITLWVIAKIWLVLRMRAEANQTVLELEDRLDDIEDTLADILEKVKK